MVKDKDKKNKKPQTSQTKAKKGSKQEAAAKKGSKQEAAGLSFSDFNKGNSGKGESSSSSVKPPKPPKRRNKLGKGPKRSKAPVKEAKHSDTVPEALFNVPELADRSEFFNEVLSNMTLYVHAETGLPKLIEGFRVVPRDAENPDGFFSLILGQRGSASRYGDDNQSKIGLDIHGQYKADPIEELVAVYPYIHYYLKKSVLRLVVPSQREGEVPKDSFWVLSSHKQHGVDNNGRILLRVMTKHSRTPLLINRIHKLSRQKVLFCGAFMDQEIGEYMPDMLIALDKGEEFRFDTIGGTFVVRNEGGGKAKVAPYVKPQQSSTSKSPKASGSGFNALVGLKLDTPEAAAKDEEEAQALKIIFTLPSRRRPADLSNTPPTPPTKKTLKPDMNHVMVSSVHGVI